MALYKAAGTRPLLQVHVKWCRKKLNVSLGAIVASEFLQHFQVPQSEYAVKFLSLHLAISNDMETFQLQYYLEKNLDARERELEREAEIEEKSPKSKAKSKMSKVTRHSLV